MTMASRLGVMILSAGVVLSTVGWLWFANKAPPAEGAYAPGGIALGGDTFCILLGSLWVIGGTLIAIFGSLSRRPHATQ